jgi:cold shock CspA family protein
MNDQILKGYLQNFGNQQGFANIPEPDLFSRFVTYCIISKQLGAPSSLADSDVDGGQDTGLDAIAITINDRLVTSCDDVDYLCKNGSIEVDFVFVQSKTSPKFDGGDMSNFVFGVRNFFSPTPTVAPNEFIASFKEIKDYIYKDKVMKLHRAPTLRLFYASTGKWTNDEYLNGRIQPDLDALRATSLFTDVRFSALDADKLKTIYRELRQSVEKEVTFEKHTILPKIEKVAEAYLGILPLSEFLKLITDDDGEIQKSLFYDNVRDFQGDNSVNSEIAATLKDPISSGNFVLLNNGVTVVAKQIRKIGESFRVSDYQIVNGCQTSHVLHLNRHAHGASIFVPIKLIVTNDPEVTNQIIKATNRQTAVTLEAFESLRAFHRTLEEFYNSFGTDDKKRLFYERRSKQYSYTDTPQTSIITLAAQAKSYLGMFLNEPHSTHRYYGEILETNRDRLFLEEHSPFIYYAAGLAISRIEDLFRRGELPHRFKRFRHHLLMLFRLSIGFAEYPPLKGPKADEYAKKLCEVLWDEKAALTKFKECISLIDTKLGQFDGDKRQSDRLRAFTATLITIKTRRPQGIVKIWNLERGFGFVRSDDGKDIFVHQSAIRDSVHKYLREGERVEFDTFQSDRGPQARDVCLVSKGAS